jgi:hypothetical protein
VPKVSGEASGSGSIVPVRIWTLHCVVGDDRFAATDEDALFGDRLQLGGQV